MGVNTFAGDLLPEFRIQLSQQQQLAASMRAKWRKKRMRRLKRKRRKMRARSSRWPQFYLQCLRISKENNSHVLISSRETGLLNISRLQVNEIKSFCVNKAYTTEAANIQVHICQCLGITSHVKINYL